MVIPSPPPAPGGKSAAAERALITRKSASEAFTPENRLGHANAPWKPLGKIAESDGGKAKTETRIFPTYCLFQYGSSGT